MLAAGQNPIAIMLKVMARTVREMRQYPQTLTFILAFLLYDDAIQTVIALATHSGTTN